MNFKDKIWQTISTIFALVLFIFICYVMFQKFSTKTVSYNGFEDDNATIAEVKKDIIIRSDRNDSDTIDFSQRTITGGGVNPGWVISLLETQPNIFTGRVIVDDGIFQHPVTLQEQVTNIFVGDMKNRDDSKQIFSMRRTNQTCTDTEGNVFEYSLTGTYGTTTFSGCGGTLIKAVE